MTVRTHTAPAGPAVLDLTQYTGRIAITVDPNATQATVTVRTTAESGPVADAVRDTEIEQNGQRITVRVPQTPGMSISGGNITFNSGGSSFNFGGGMNGVTFGGVSGRIIVNGVDVTQAVRDGGGQDAAAEIETTVTLPLRSWVRMATHSATTTVRGILESLDYGGTSGNLTADRVGHLTLDLTSGQAVVNQVTEKLSADLTSGSLSVGVYAGNDARVKLTSGSARVNATPASQGQFAIKVTSGSAVLTGTQHLDVSRRVTSGYLSVN